jgi:YebC/PmpR family DNA-binding regulatory protein
MSGHSKWANIKRKKGVNDKAKGKIFGKLARMITLAVVESNGATNPDHNVRLRLAIEKAKHENLPKENIHRAIEKGSGPGMTQLKEEIYEAFAPGGVALILLATTDSVNRTLSELRFTLERHGGKLGNRGSVAYLFQRCGLVTFDKQANKEEDVFVFSEKIEALDMDEDDLVYSVYFPYEKLGHVKDFLGNLKSGPPDVDYRPNTTVAIEKKEAVEKIITLIEALESLDDVHKVFTNFTVANELLT